MDKLTFTQYINYRPKLHELILFWIMMAIYIISFILAILLSLKYFPVFQNFIYNKGNDVVFSLYAIGIFSLAFFFVSLMLNWTVIQVIFSISHSAKNVILWYEVVGAKTNDYNIYKKINKRNIIFVVSLLVVSLFFIFVSSFVHLRINDSGIYYNKIFEFTEKYYGWNGLKSVSVVPKITRGKRDSLSPEMIIEFGENKIDIWGGAGLGSPDSDTLIKVIDFINHNTEIIINVDNNFTDKILDLLYNHSADTKRNNIINVFSYLNKKQ
jgi:hypothetical protein